MNVSQYQKTSAQTTLPLDTYLAIKMNNTISLGGYKGIGTADWAMKLTNIQANSIIAPVVPSMDENRQLLILGLSLKNIAAFTHYRYKVYSYIFKRFKGKELTPVDFMTLTVCLVQHSELLWDLIMGVLMISVTNGYMDVNTVMPSFCPFVNRVTTSCGPILCLVDYVLPSIELCLSNIIIQSITLSERNPFYTSFYFVKYCSYVFSL